MKWNNASKIAVAGVAALGITVAVSTFASDGSNNKPIMEVLTYSSKDNGGKVRDKALGNVELGFSCVYDHPVTKDGFTATAIGGDASTNSDGRLRRSFPKGSACRVEIYPKKLASSTLRDYYLLPQSPRVQYLCVKQGYTSRATFVFNKLGAGQKTPANAGNYKAEDPQHGDCKKDFDQKMKQKTKHQDNNGWTHIITGS